MSKSKETQLAWAAGFFDGEGHVRSKFNGRTCEMQVAQKTTECLEKLKLAAGNVGTIGGPYHKRNPVYFWYLTKTSEVDYFLTRLWPYLSEPKKDQAIKAGFKLGVIRTPKTGRPNRKLSELKLTTCHPDRKHVGLGLCSKCYHKEYERKKKNNG